MTLCISIMLQSTFLYNCKYSSFPSSSMAQSLSFNLRTFLRPCELGQHQVKTGHLVHSRYQKSYGKTILEPCSSACFRRLHSSTGLSTVYKWENDSSLLSSKGSRNHRLITCRAFSRYGKLVTRMRVQRAERLIRLANEGHYMLTAADDPRDFELIPSTETKPGIAKPSWFNAFMMPERLIWYWLRYDRNFMLKSFKERARLLTTTICNAIHGENLSQLDALVDPAILKQIAVRASTLSQGQREALALNAEDIGRALVGKFSILSRDEKKFVQVLVRLSCHYTGGIDVLTDNDMSSDDKNAKVHQPDAENTGNNQSAEEGKLLNSSQSDLGATEKDQSYVEKAAAKEVDKRMAVYEALRDEPWRMYAVDIGLEKQCYPSGDDSCRVVYFNIMRTHGFR